MRVLSILRDVTQKYLDKENGSILRKVTAIIDNIIHQLPLVVLRLLLHTSTIKETAQLSLYIQICEGGTNRKDCSLVVGGGGRGTHSLGECGQLLRVDPAKDVETIGEGEDEQDVRDDENGQDVVFARYLVIGHILRPVLQGVQSHLMGWTGG